MRRLLQQPGLLRILVSAAILSLSGCFRLDSSQVPFLSDLGSLGARVPTEEDTANLLTDRDQDGIVDILEDQLGTSHANPDSDNDGIDDALELVLATNPIQPNATETVDDVPPAFDGLLEPGEQQAFFRGAASPANAYLRLFGLVRTTTRVLLHWQEVIDKQPVTRASTMVTFEPRQSWCWGHDVGGSAVISDPAEMVLTSLEVSVLEGDSVPYLFLSSGGLLNGPRGFLPTPPELRTADLDFDLLLCHGLGDEAASWDSFAMMGERLSPRLRILRIDVEPQGAVNQRANQLANFIVGEAPTELYAAGHSMGGLDLRYIVTKAAQGDAMFLEAGQAIQAIYTIATPHRGAFLASLLDQFPELTQTVDDGAPAVIDLEPGSDVIDYLNGSFAGDITLGDRVVPVVALTFHAGEPTFPNSDGVVELISQSFGSHVISDVPSTRGNGPGAGKHVPFIPTRSDVELYSFEVFGRILSDIVARREAQAAAGNSPIAP